MDIYTRRRIYAIGGVLLVSALAIMTFVWNTYLLHIIAIDPPAQVLPSTQQTITITYSQSILDAKITSIKPETGYTISVDGDKVVVRLSRAQSEGSKLELSVTANGTHGSLNSHFSFSVEYVDFNRLSEAEQTALIDASDGISEHFPLDGEIPRVDISGPYRISYGTSSSSSTASLVISHSTPRGRTAAIAWIRSQGVDPTSLDIQFDGYVNPLVPGGAQ